MKRDELAGAKVGEAARKRLPAFNRSGSSGRLRQDLRDKLGKMLHKSPEERLRDPYDPSRYKDD